jgi:methylphosphotriester-DNA--protein-cysteine methyltransferase
MGPGPPEMIDDRYREYAPAAALRPYVACYWTSTAPPRSAPRLVLPDGCIDILFDVSPSRRPEGTIVGTMTRPLLFQPEHAVHLVAVRFRPGGAVAFLGLPADAITDDEIGLAPGWRAERIAERIQDARDDERRVRRLESALLARLAQCAPLDTRVTAAVALFEGGVAEVDAVAASVRVTRQHLVRLFRRHVGLGPKGFARVLRLQRLRSQMQRPATPDWAALALEAGYYDQSHMIAECRGLTGLTPRELQKA